MSGFWWQDRGEFERRWKAHNYNLCALADGENISSSTANKWKNKHRLEYPAHVNPKGNTRNRPSVLEPPPLVNVVDTQLRIQGDAGVSSDWHAPLSHYETFHRFLDDSHKAGLTQGICAGDLTNQDALAGHDDKQEGAELEPEIEHLCYSVSAALDVFDTLYVTLGNHDRHLAQKAKVSLERSLRMLLADLPKDKLDRIVVTARDSIVVETERGEWLICHTRSYSRLPLAYPNKLALRHGVHIAAGHRHHHAQGKAANGCDIVELGGFQDGSRMAYVNRYTNDLPQMANGYGLLVGGYMRCPMLYS